MSTQPVTTNQPPALPPARRPDYKDPHYSVSDFVREYLHEKMKDIVKGTGYALFWIHEGIPGVHSNVNKLSIALNEFKNVLAAIEVPAKVYTLYKSALVLKAEMSAFAGKAAGATAAKVRDAGLEVFKNATYVLNNVTDGIDFSTRYLPINHHFLRVLKGVNFSGTIAASSISGVQDGIKLAAAAKQVKKMDDNHAKAAAYHMVNIAKDVSYFAVGAVGLSFVLANLPMVPWMIIAPLSSGLVCSISSLFMEKMWDPNGTGQNLSSSVVAHNARLQNKEYQRSGVLFPMPT